jgi:N-acyl-D-amino-acid deacylase
VKPDRFQPCTPTPPSNHESRPRELPPLRAPPHDDGLRVLAQVSGRPVGILECFAATVHPFMLCPTWGLIHDLPEEERLAHLRDPAIRERLVAESPAEWSDFVGFVTRTWDKLYPFAGEADYEPEPAASVAAIAERENRPPAEVAYDHLLENDGRGLLYFPLFNYSNHHLDHLLELHQHPHTRMGLADAGAHCGTIADGGMPTFMLQFWARDRTRGGHMALEWLVHRQTRQTAELYGLHDRGLIAPGMRADLNVIDFDGLGVELPHLVGDLPTGANRYVQRARGYGATICRGTVTVTDDQFTGEHPGRLLRGPQPADPRR